MSVERQVLSNSKLVNSSYFKQGRMKSFQVLKWQLNQMIDELERYVSPNTEVDFSTFSIKAEYDDLGIKFNLRAEADTTHNDLMGALIVLAETINETDELDG